MPILKVFLIGDAKIPWPGLDKLVFVTPYNTPYSAI
jgi:lactate permease